MAKDQFQDFGCSVPEITEGVGPDRAPVVPQVEGVPGLCPVVIGLPVRLPQD